jgi:ABC-type nitrate/sulfonate/bicarbonate transport system permease component
MCGLTILPSAAAEVASQKNTCCSGGPFRKAHQTVFILMSPTIRKMTVTMTTDRNGKMIAPGNQVFNVSKQEALPSGTASPSSATGRTARGDEHIAQNVMYGAGWLWTGISFLVAAILWELTAHFLITNRIFFVPLAAIVTRAVQLWESHELQNHILVSSIEFGGGFALAIVGGMAFGLMLAGSRILRNFFEPWVSMLYATPIIALGPLFILWLGIGVASKIAIVFLTAVFPILINTVAGLATTDPMLIDVARSFGATKGQIYRKIRIPAAAPFIIAGLRLSVARALVGVVVAELFGARAGLGFLILTSAQNFDTAALFLGVIIFAIAGAVSIGLLNWLEASFKRFRPELGE